MVVAGGMESMSRSPYYMDRGNTPYGGVQLKVASRQVHICRCQSLLTSSLYIFVLESSKMSSSIPKSNIDCIIEDGIVLDALTDAGSGLHMGMCTEQIASSMGITRQVQDDYAAMAYRRTAAAYQVTNLINLTLTCVSNLNNP